MASGKAGQDHHGHHALPQDPFHGKSSKNYDFRLSQSQLLNIKRGNTTINIPLSTFEDECILPFLSCYFSCLFLSLSLSVHTLVFDAFDDDFDGVIDIQYLGLAMRAGGLILTEKDIESLTSEYDPEEKGVISLPNFFVLMARKMRDISIMEDSVKKAFKKSSKATLISGSDDYNITALRNILIGKGGDVFSETELDDFIRDATALSDQKAGTISLQVLLSWVMCEVPYAKLLEEKTEADQKAKEAKKSKKKSKDKDA